MKNFAQIAIPHEDIVKGKLTMDVFAADLWQVITEKAPEDYRDPDLFFSKTYLTRGLKNILDIARSRLEGKSGDSIIQLQTPFGGGKTHTLIALYHKAREWGANVVVFDGTALSPRTKPWEELERQLTGKVELMKGPTSPGKEKIVNLLSKHTPVLILMDEVLEYVTKAAAVKIGDSNLASQTFAFIQELTAAVSTVGNSLLVLTLPSSILEHYDENAERMFQQLQKITGRMEKIYTPVEDEEIEHVVRARLFSKIDEKEVKKIVHEFVEYAKNEGILSDEDYANYRDKFLRSYPFKPEVIEVLYKRWGSFPTFQRTRGVLRLLSLVVHDLLDKDIPFIRLGDFNLDNNEIRRELVKHIGSEWDSILAQDIISDGSGAKKVDNSMGTSYKPYRLGTVVSTTIFMLSFSGRGEKGATIKEIKLSTVLPEFHSSEIDNVINNLREKLFYLSDEGLFFTNQPNLNRMIIAREESISEKTLDEMLESTLKRHISKLSPFKVYIHPKFSKDIPDVPDLKLIILNKPEPDDDFLLMHGESSRIYRNTLIFLCTDESQRDIFYSYLRRMAALESIDEDKSLKLTEGQRKEIKNKLKLYSQREYEELRKLYRKVFLPAKEGFKMIDLGIPTFGESFIDKEIYSSLKAQGEILEKITPKLIEERYLGGKEFIQTKNLFEAFLRSPGEIRLVSNKGFIEGIKEGVKKGLFGLGQIKDERIECKYLNEISKVELTDDEVIIRADICLKEKAPETQKEPLSYEHKTYEPGKHPKFITQAELPREESYSKIALKLDVPVGQISTIAKIVNYLRTKFDNCEIEVYVRVEKGTINISEYEDKIQEALLQSGIRIKEERKE